MQNLKIRVLTSLILLPLALFALVNKGILLVILLGLFSFGACYESYSIILPGQRRAFIITCLFWCSLFFANFVDLKFSLLFFMIPLTVTHCILLFSFSLEKYHFEKITAIVFWCIYIVFAFSSVYWLANISTPNMYLGSSFIIVGCLSTWCNDILAYFGGRIMGRRSLFASVSQKKTWEGFFCGSLGSFLVVPLVWCTGFFAPVFFNELSLADILWIAIPSIVLAPLGDLIESKFKRFYGVKDSSNLLPGHGGILDRIDGLLLMLSWTCMYAFIIRPLC
jgi:phosphatidate cytidylyltransferase